jgi:hypothetical protein
MQSGWRLKSRIPKRSRIGRPASLIAITRKEVTQ